MKSFLLSSLMFIGSLNAQGPPAQQGVPPVAPPGPPTGGAPSAQGGAPPAGQGQLPPATSQQPPVQQQPAPYNPYAPQQPAPYNPYGMQPQPYNPYAGAGFMQMDPQNLDCKFGQCMNRKITLQPGQGFNLKCHAMQCNGLDLTLNVGHDPTNWGSGVSDISDLTFEGPLGPNGATIRINPIMGNNVEINNLHCKTVGSCNNLKVFAGFGVETWGMNVHCDVPGACNGCTINGQSCQMIAMATGNNNGYMPYGYGYTNVPNTPQYNAPQQPGYGAPQQPGYGAPPMPQQGAPQYPAFNPYQQWI